MNLSQGQLQTREVLGSLNFPCLVFSSLKFELQHPEPLPSVCAGMWWSTWNLRIRVQRK